MWPGCSQSRNTRLVNHVPNCESKIMKISVRTLYCYSALAWAVLAGPLAASAAENMIGRQSQNEGILVLPAPKQVNIDGDLSEWDWSGRIWIFADTDVRAQYSVEVAAMWDADNLYLAAKWKDPTPMFSTVDPVLNPSEGWKADAMQLRIRTDKISHPTLWYYTPKKMPVFDIQYGQSLVKPFGGPGKFCIFKENATKLGRGIESAYRADADGQGFVQEVKIPWAVICDKVPAWKAGDKFQIGMEFLWGDPTGHTFPIHRYADNLQPGQTSREFFWEAWKNWGNATLVDKGHVPVRQYIADVERLAGTVPVRVNIPADAARFTVVIETPDGKRVRNLAGDFDPADYTVAGSEQNGRRDVEVLWDCLDDKGQLVTPGNYRVRGLTQRGLGAEYERCLYNPGTPPWATKAGNGAWGADHSAPHGVAAGGDWTFVSWQAAEGGSGVIGIDPTGQKRWEDRRGTSCMAADEKYVYTYVTNWYTKETLCRYDAHTGTPQAWDGHAFDCPLADLLGGAVTGQVVGLATGAGQIVIALDDGKLAVLDTATAKLLKTIEAPNPTAVAFGKTGQLYAVLNGKVSTVDIASGKSATIATPGVENPVALAVDQDGNVVVMDGGADYQIKAYTLAGKLAYTAGKKGGRPIRGDFDSQALSHVSSVAVDATGNIWAVENWNYPRRVSVWGRDGKLVRDYIGNTGYAGAATYLHDQRPELAYVGPIELKIDRAANKWSVTRILWVPDEAKGECFPISTAANVMPQRFTSSVSGQPHEYLYAHDDDRDTGGQVLYMERHGTWQPVSAICRVGQISGKMGRGKAVPEEPSGEFTGLDPFDVAIWNDLNGDGKVQRTECTIIPAITDKKGKHPQTAISLNNGWGGRMGQDLVFYTDGLTQFRPLRFTADGAPIYGLEGMTKLPVDDTGDLVPVPAENLLLCLSFKGYSGPTKGMEGINPKTGGVAWSYPCLYPGVHGSHRAPMAQAGLLIGPLKICGVAHVNDTVGNVALLRGNLGQDFLFTTDGLYVGAMFRDCRLPGEKLPETEAGLRGKPMTGYSEGGEPFNGWFGKQSDGVIRLTTGLPRQAAMVLQVTGLDGIQRFTGGTVAIDPATVVAADHDNASRARAVTEKKEYTIARNTGQWTKVNPLTVARSGLPDRALVRLAYDDQNLYARFEVQDSSPWLNEGKDFGRLFKTGDAVDIQLGAAAGSELRVVIANFAGKPTAVLMKPVDASAPVELHKAYTSPVGTKKFDRVEVLTAATIKVLTKSDGYTVEATLPWAALGLKPMSGQPLRGDVGIISSDTAGLINVARTYWANPHTNLVNDEPLEAVLTPTAWGLFTFE